MDTPSAATQPLRWHSAEIIEFPDPHPAYKLPHGKLWKTLIQLQKGGFVRAMRDPLGVLRFCAVKPHTFAEEVKQKKTLQQETS